MTHSGSWEKMREKKRRNKRKKRRERETIESPQVERESIAEKGRVRKLNL